MWKPTPSTLPHFNFLIVDIENAVAKQEAFKDGQGVAVADEIVTVCATRELASDVVEYINTHETNVYYRDSKHHYIVVAVRLI